MGAQLSERPPFDLRYAAPVDVERPGDFAGGPVPVEEHLDHVVFAGREVTSGNSQIDAVGDD